MPEEVPRFQRYLTNLLTVGCDEIVCQWIHPQEGIRYIRCSGKCESQDGESYILNGYYQDITEMILRKEENRSSARLLENDYLRVSYIDLNQDKIFTLKCVENEREVQDTFSGRSDCRRVCGTGASWGCWRYQSAMQRMWKS